MPRIQKISGWKSVYGRKPWFRRLVWIGEWLHRHYGARVFLVGGAVRNLLTQRPVHDVDLEVYGVAPDRFAEAMDRLGARGVGRAFYVYRYENFDIALPRREQKSGRGHRGFDVVTVDDPAVASRRRDFTVNALMIDLREDRLLDFWGGLEDLRARKLRCIDPERFAEDSLRVLRAMRFAAQLGFRVEERTCRVCREIPLDDLPGARIFGEFERMFRADDWIRGLYELLRLGIAERLWGETGGFRLFYSAGKEMARFRPRIPPAVLDTAFLAIYGQHSEVPMVRILDALETPRRYRRRLESVPKIPRRVSPAFVGSLAKREGVVASVLAYHPDIRKVARKIGVWDAPLDPGVTPRELIKRGLRGAEIGREIRRRQDARIRALEHYREEGS